MKLLLTGNFPGRPRRFWGSLTGTEAVTLTVTAVPGSVGAYTVVSAVSIFRGRPRFLGTVICATGIAVAAGVLATKGIARFDGCEANALFRAFLGLGDFRGRSRRFFGTVTGGASTAAGVTTAVGVLMSSPFP